MNFIDLFSFLLSFSWYNLVSEIKSYIDIDSPILYKISVLSGKQTAELFARVDHTVIYFSEFYSEIKHTYVKNRKILW